MSRAPNSTKHPKTANPPRRQSIRPRSIRTPTTAIASTAITVAMVPVSAIVTQSAAAVIALVAGGSNNELSSTVTGLNPFVDRAGLPESRGTSPHHDAVDRAFTAGATELNE